MLYKIEIVELVEKEGNNYPSENRVYEQKIENLNVPKLVAALNNTTSNIN